MSSQDAVSAQQRFLHSTFDSLPLGKSSQAIHARLLRFWDSPSMNDSSEFIGINLLFLDEKDSMINGFIPGDRTDLYRSSLQEGNIYKVAHFEVERCPQMYKTTEHIFVIRFIDQTTLDEVINYGPVINDQKFMVRNYDHLNILADTTLELSDVVGEIKSVQGYGLKNTRIVSPVLIRFLIAPGIQVYLSLLDDAAAVFKGLLNSGDGIRSVMVVTSLNPEKIGDDLHLSSTAATKFYFGNKLPAIADFTKRGAETEDLPNLNAETVITSKQLSSVGDLNMFLSNSTGQDVYFACKARIVEVVSKNGWYYVSCTRCGKKFEKTATSLACNQCDNPNATGVVRYRVELLVDDGSNYATFLVYDKDMLKLTKQPAATLLDNEVNLALRNKLPECLAELIGRDFVYHVRVTACKFKTNSPTFTVSGISDVCNYENFHKDGNKIGQEECGETSATATATNTSANEVKEGGPNNSSD
ncbi:hypothetical protein Bca101_019581 [Brassica carinata]